MIKARLASNRIMLTSVFVFSTSIFPTVALSGDLDDIAKPKETDTQPAPEPRIEPKVEPKTEPKTEPKADPVIPDSKADVTPQSHEGVMEFGARLISNMEHGFHILDDGYKAVCIDSQGVVAQAKMDIYAAVNGEVANIQNTNGYKPVKLRPALEYVRQGATTGTCSLKVCLPKGEVTPGKDFACDERATRASQTPDAERPVELKESNVAYSVSGKDVSLKTKFLSVSAYHPVYGFAAPGKAFNDYQSPLVIDFSKKQKLNLVDVWDSKVEVRFDLLGDGAAVRSGWIGSNMGLVAFDFNGNGKIDNGLELFGEYTQGAKMRQDGRRWDNGFLSLAQFDSNQDGVINHLDKDYSKILVWKDRNLNGKSDRSELISLAKSGVKSISLRYNEVLENGHHPKVAGNEVRLISHVEMNDGSKKQIVDVWFRQRRFAERPMASVDFN
jgi:hypothetical protein